MSTGPIDRLLRLLPLAALGVALAQSASAEAATPSAEASTSAEAASIVAPFLWQIDGGGTPSYLFGTIHAGVGAAELPPVVDAALSRSDLFVMETTPGDMLQRAPEAQDQARFPMGVPMDMMLARAAHQSGIPVATLESVRFQLSLLEQVGGAKELAAMLADDSEAIEPLIDAYRGGDLEQIAELTHMGDPALRKVLLTGRNHRWVRQLSSILLRGGAFMAVGVGHCPGQDGLLQLLEQRGLSIRRMA